MTFVNGYDMMREVEQLGYCKVAGASLVSSGRELIGCFGTILDYHDIKIIDSPDRPVLNTHRAMYFHVDAPVADYVVWRCVSPGYRGEDVLLVDLEPVFQKLGAEARNLLRSVDMQLPEGYRVRNRYLNSYSDYPLLEFRAKKWRVNYTPWLTPLLSCDKKASAYNTFVSLVNDEIKCRKISVYLDTNEWLIVDNRRLLHSRSQLSPQSPRHHIRYWIQAGRA